MPSITMTKEVNAPLDVVFNASIDFENADKNVQGIERLELLTPKPIGVGTRFRETRIIFKKESTEELEITQFEPGKSYTISCNSCGAQFDSRFSFTEEQNKTILKLELDYKAVSFTAKLMWPISKLMLGSMKKMIDRDLDDIKKVAESGRTAI